MEWIISDLRWILSSGGPIGYQLALDWFISDPANRTLPSIEGSDRLADTEMNSLISSQLALNGQWLVVNWQSVWKQIVNQLAFDWFISDPANRTLPSLEGSSRLAHLHSIGGLQLWSTPKISPKSRLLIGRELRMLASHWSRGSSGNSQRGYPYDPEPGPIEWFWPQLSLDLSISGSG